MPKVCISASASGSKIAPDADAKIFSKILSQLFLLIGLKSLVSASASAFSN
jgi:hypothetical protein